MKHKKVYPTIWQSIPFSLDTMEQWDDKGNRIEDLVLVNDMATQRNVSEMILNVAQISIVDDSGMEHFMTKFKGNEALNLKGLHTGLFLKTKEAIDLKPGNYKSFRFHLMGQGNYFFNKERNMEAVYGFSFLEFNIQNGLIVTGKESKQVILRFDFTPCSFSSYFKPFISLFKKSKTVTYKWANSLGQ